jgi:hypothetical protein
MLPQLIHAVPGFILGALILLVALTLVLWLDPTIPTPQDTQLLLTDTITKTANFDTPGLLLTGTAFAPGGIGLPGAAIINVTACDRADSNETYTFKLQESADNSTFTDCGAPISVTVAGAVATLGVIMAKGIVTKPYVRLDLVVGGTTPSITYKAWFNPTDPD